MSDRERAAIAMQVINATCSGDGHTLWNADTVMQAFDAAGVPETHRPYVWTLTKSDVANLRRQGGYGTVGARLVSGDSIVGVLARWAGVDTSPADRYMGRGTSHRARIACIAQAAQEVQS